MANNANILPIIDGDGNIVYPIVNSKGVYNDDGSKLSDTLDALVKNVQDKVDEIESQYSLLGVQIVKSIVDVTE